jgi:hypothetical protein
MRDEHAAAAARGVHVVAMHLQVSEHRAVQVAELLVMVARNIDDARAVLGLAKQGAQHVVVQLRPEEIATHVPDVDNVADQEELFHVHAVQEVEQQIGAALPCTEVHVRQEYAAYVNRWASVGVHGHSVAGGHDSDVSVALQSSEISDLTLQASVSLP